MSETAAKMTDATSKISCHEITFDGLDATMRCQVSTRPPLQPRKRSLDFMAELEKTQSILVTYPESLDMKLDEKSGFLTTEFSLQVTYIPSRYEPERIKQLTYDKQ